LEAFQRAHAADNEEKAVRELDQGLKYLKEAVLESRRLVSGLRSLALDDLGLAGALEQLLAEEKHRAHWSSADMIHNVADTRFDRAMETAVYRVAQEALTNVRKHAEADRVRLSVLAEGQHLHLEVRDWGKGFNPDEFARDYSHVGLQGMTERATLMGGRIELKSTLGEGTSIRARFPVLQLNTPVNGGNE
jgi:signal transduction histidine kinase